MNHSVPNYGIKEMGNSPAISLPTLPIGGVLGLSGLPGGGNKIYDRSPYGNPGTITGAVWKVLPSGLWYLDFDGTDDYINAGNSSALRPTVVTLLCWVKPEAQALSQILISMPYDGGADWDAPYVAYSIQRLIDSGNMQADINVGGTYRAVDSGIVLPYSAWSYCGLTYDGTTLRTYVNGVAGANGAWSGVIAYGSPVPNLSIGVRNVDSLGNYFKGGIALLKVYNRVLSAFELQNHYHQEKHLFAE